MDILSSFENVLAQLTAAHKKDPNRETWNNEIFPAEWLYISRITDRLASFSPEASTELIVAANCQHLCRWEIERTSFPDGRIGYYQWRNYLSDYQFQKARNIILEAGFGAEFADRVKLIVKKRTSLPIRRRKRWKMWFAWFLWSFIWTILSVQKAN